MLYLTIKNRGVCPIEGFTMLGVSTARGQSEKIGQFGSGNKMGILTLLRMGLNPVVYIGREKIQFHTEPALMGGEQSYNKVFVKVGNKAPRELSMALEYGEMDWTGVDMALREFVSNALDATDGDPSQIEFKVVERIHPEEGCTVVGVPLCPEVQRFYQEIGQRFLHFNKQKELLERWIIDKTGSPSPANIFRKGVFVRQRGEKPALFDYNMGEELRIDESRNLDDWSVNNAAISNFAEHATVAQISKVLRAVVEAKDVWELGFAGNWRLTDKMKENKEKWRQIWRQTFGDNAVVGVMPEIDQMARAKGYVPIPIANGSWRDALRATDIPSTFSVLDNVNDKGHQLSDPTPEAIKARDEVWEWLQLLGLTQNKDCPPMVLYTDIMKGGTETCGYYKDGKIFLALEHATNKQTILEELAHYITGAMDCTRDFQDFAFRVAAKMMEV